MSAPQFKTNQENFTGVDWPECLRHIGYKTLVFKAGETAGSGALAQARGN